MGDEIKKYEPELKEEKARGYGRPPKYSDDILDQAYEYLMGGWKEVGQQLPSKVGLALYLGVVSSTVDNWCADDDKADFLGICEAVMDMQHSCLLNNGLTGMFVAPITKMMMTKHGYSDKVENINTNTEKTVFISPEEQAAMEKNIDDVVDG